jgi:hypothetical protein
MALSAQDKIMYVANKLGLSTLNQMQGSTGAVYDTDISNVGILFGNASQHTFPAQTNVTENKFEVNSALLIETIAFYRLSPQAVPLNLLYPPNGLVGSDVLVFDLIIGNKVVMKDTPVFLGGGPTTFASMPKLDDTGIEYTIPRHQIFLEGAGILIPPQVEWSIQYSIYNFTTGLKKQVNPSTDGTIAAYLFGTRVLLNFNTTL